MMPCLAQITVAVGDQITAHSLLLRWALDAVVAILGLAILLVVFRLLRGPTLPDRVVALDMIGTLAAGAIAVYAVRENQPVYLFVAVVLALVLFVGTVAFGFYLEKGIKRTDSPSPGTPAATVEQAAADKTTPPPPPSTGRSTDTDPTTEEP